MDDTERYWTTAEWRISENAYEQYGEPVHQILYDYPCAECGPAKPHIGFIFETDDLELAKHVCDLHNAAAPATPKETP